MRDGERGGKGGEDGILSRENFCNISFVTFLWNMFAFLVFLRA